MDTVFGQYLAVLQFFLMANIPIDDDGGFSYVLMTGECKKESRSKVKIEKWLGESNVKAYERFVIQWKNILEETRKQLEDADAEMQKQLSVSLLQKYYLTPYGADFFAEFGGREEK